MESDTYEGSSASFSSALDLLTLPTTDISIVSSDYYPCYPQSGFKDANNPIIITVPPNSSQWTDLANSYVYIKLKIKTKDDTALLATHQVAGCEHFYSALFESCDLLINGVPVQKNSSSSLYAYKYLLETLLGYGKAA